MVDHELPQGLVLVRGVLLQKVRQLMAQRADDYRLAEAVAVLPCVDIHINRPVLGIHALDAAELPVFQCAVEEYHVKPRCF